LQKIGYWDLAQIRVHSCPFVVVFYQLRGFGFWNSDFTFVIAICQKVVAKRAANPQISADMSTVAEKLRQAREAKNLTVNQVADVTKIRTDHIRALEEGNFDMFSAPVYIRGFVRTYSTLLKLNVPETMAELDTELGQTEKFSEPPPLTDQKKGPLDFVMLQLSRIDWRKGVIVLGGLAALAIIIAIVLAVRNRSSRNPLKNLKPGIYQPARNSGQTLPVPGSHR
jgi:transcriptional regulator with XRE-family HTH domain